ncbi:MAG: hypothetical protein R3C55_06825 [Parvularculaceae bacterium]
MAARSVSLRQPAKPFTPSTKPGLRQAAGKDEGLPGPRTFTPTAYAAYLRDPDGNKICTYCFAAE